jgi:hypothetical protein
MTARNGKKSFVKAAETTVAPEKSRAEVERLLRRYGAVGFATTVDLEKAEIRVEFVVPNSKAKDAPRVPVRLPVSVHQVYDSLYGQPTKWTADGRVHDPKGYDAKRMLQAERVAWRNLVLWIDAALSAATVGVQTITEAFFAHTIVVDDGGRAERMVDYVERTGGAIGPGVRALLPSSTT